MSHGSVVEKCSYPRSSLMPPSLRIIPFLAGARGLIVIVSNAGTEEFPKAVFQFREVIAYMVEDEVVSPLFDGANVKFNDFSFYNKWSGSPWLAEHAEIQNSTRTGPLSHYVLIGAEFVLQLLTVREPEIVEVKNESALQNLFNFLK